MSPRHGVYDVLKDDFYDDLVQDDHHHQLDDDFYDNLVQDVHHPHFDNYNLDERADGSCQCRL